MTPYIIKETCLEYYKRRLKEGWKEIKRDGFNVVLLSLDGIERQIDLRNDVETLRPNAAGDETSIQNHNQPSGEHWEQVDEAIADDSSTTVFTASEVYERDLYNLPQSSGSGTINFIKIYFRVWTDYGGGAKPSLKSGSTVVDGNEVSVSSVAWQTYSQRWDKNPADNEAWEWSDIDALQIGVSLRGDGQDLYCTQVYVEVDYTPTPPAPTLVSPSDTTTGTSPVTFIWKIPSNIDNKPVHAHIQIDKTSDAFGDLEKDLYSHKDAGFEYYNGTDWVAYPITGVTSDYYGNQARITLTLTTGWKYWRVRGGVALS